MKKLLLFIVIVACCMPACKKGKEDPWLSLRSRNARVTGEWKMTAMESASTLIDNATYPYYSEQDEEVTTITYDGILEITISNHILTTGTPTITTDWSYVSTSVDEVSYSLKINKDGTFEKERIASPVSYNKNYSDPSLTDINETYSGDSYSETSFGHWWWDHDRKKKTMLVFDYSPTVYLFPPFALGDIQDVLRLSNKEMIWDTQTESTNVFVGDSTGYENASISSVKTTWSKQ